MSTRILSSPGLSAIGLPEAAARPAAPGTRGASALGRPAGGSLRKRPATPAGEPSPAAPRAPIDALRDPKRRALAGTWARSEEAVSLQGLGHGGLGLRASASGEVGVGLRGQTRFHAHGRLGDAVVQGRGELSATVQGSGQVSAGRTGLNVQAGGVARAGLQAESDVALQAPEAAVKLAGVRMDMTPNADAHGRASLGAEGRGTVFAGVRVPTAAERAAGTGLKAGLEASGSAFAGARAEGDAHLGIGGNKIGVTGGVWAGAGAAGKATGSLARVDGHTTARLELKAGAALGVGGSLGLTAQVDVQPVVDAAHKVAALGHAISHHRR